MAVAQVKESAMRTKNEQELIRGEFEAVDAQDIVNYLISKKINFHDRRNFSSEIRFGISDEFSIKRSKELTESKAELNELIQHAKEIGRTVRISSTISIEIV